MPFRYHHVPEEHLHRYRHLRGITELLDSAGDHMGSEFAEDANRMYALAGKYRRMADELRYKDQEPLNVQASNGDKTVHSTTNK
jgi:hypothetical protein